MSATHCLAERSPDCAMYLVGSGRPCAGQDHLLIKAFKMFRLKTIQPMLANVGY
jgi:hypothetical protein